MTQRTNAPAAHDALCPGIVNTQERSERCDSCSLRGNMVRGELHSSVPVDYPQVMVIAEAPGEEEARTGRPLVGMSGQEARHHLDINGISRLGVWLDNVVKCRPPENRNPTTEEIRICVTNFLLPKILELQPKWIITMGRISTQVIQDIQGGKY